MFHQLIGFEFCCCGALVWLSLCLWKGFSILTTIPNRSFHTKYINFKIQKKKLSTFLFYFERRNRLLWNYMDANNVCMQSYNSRWIKFEWMPSLRFKKKSNDSLDTFIWMRTHFLCDKRILKNPKCWRFYFALYLLQVKICQLCTWNKFTNSVCNETSKTLEFKLNDVKMLFDFISKENLLTTLITCTNRWRFNV